MDLKTSSTAEPGKTSCDTSGRKSSRESGDLACCVTSCEQPLDQQYWNERWELKETKWDTGMPTPAIKTYMRQFHDKHAAILIPGCGNAWEAAFLVNEGFTNITLLDIAPKAVEILREKFADNPQVKVLCEDFFQHKGQYDLMIEQTFFCAILPEQRNAYAEKAAELLRDDGRIIGVLFDRTFDPPGPPFGGCPCEYKPVFESRFIIKVMDTCYNSIPGRIGKEVFINLVKKPAQA